MQNINEKEIYTSNFPETLLSSNDIASVKKKQKSVQSNRTIYSDCKNFMENDFISKDEIIYNSIPINFSNPFPIDKPSDKPKLNGMAMAGLISILISVLLLTFSTTGGTFFLPMGIICLVGAAILSIIGYKEIKKGQSKGKWFAIVGLALEILVAAFILFYFLIFPQISLIG